MVQKLACTFRGFHYFAGNRIAHRAASSSQAMEMIMNPHPQKYSKPSGIVEWLLDLAIRLLARSLQMPAPLVHAIGAFVFAHVQEADRRLLALCRPSR